MNSVLSHVADSVKQLSPYQPGRPIAEVAREKGITDVIKLASNENPLGPGTLALAAIRQIDAEQLSRYPDANGNRLREGLAQQLSVPAEQIILGNGSNDILELAAHLLLTEGTSAVYSQHAFIVYALATAARRANAHIVKADHYQHNLSAIAAATQNSDTRLVFIANPNNPTGSWHPPAAIERCLNAIPPDVLVIVDEAYGEYLPDPTETSLPLLEKFNNLLITRTFSKIHGLAGLRAGYGIGDIEIIQMLNRIRQPFNMGITAQLAAEAALADTAHIEKSRRLNTEGLKTLTANFKTLNIPCLTSYGNFLTFQPAQADVLHATLLDNGIIVRSLKEYDLPAWLRVSVGSATENDQFLRCLHDNN